MHGITNSLPHARGGVSAELFPVLTRSRSSPRTWGCFFSCEWNLQSIEVFPTHVGVFLKDGEFYAVYFGLPHARGGVSKYNVAVVTSGGSSPRTWGCF